MCKEDGPTEDVFALHEQAIKEAEELLPAWFIRRMMDDVWHFGLLMSDGTLIGIQAIERVSVGADKSIWIDVRLKVDGSYLPPENKRVFIAPTSRETASINTAHIAAAFELADT